MKDLPLEIPRVGERGARALDAIVAGAAHARGLGRNRLRSTWVLVARNSEPVEDFFLDSPFGEDGRPAGRDPIPWICRGVRADGTLRMAAVDLDVDRFVSDVLNEGLEEK